MAESFELSLLRLTLVIAVAFDLAWAPQLHGQTTSDSGGSDDRPEFGFWFGVESVPAGVDRNCWESTGRRGMTLLGASIVFPVGPIGVESRVGRHWSSTGTICDVDGPLLQLGTHRERTPQLPAGSFTALDVRLRWTPLDSRSWFVSAGGGWAASPKRVPYLSASLGTQGAAGTLRVGAELAMTAYRVPWTHRVLQVTEGAVVEVSRRLLDEWAPTVGVRFSVGVPTYRERRASGP
jgi:hypothetical protein